MSNVYDNEFVIKFQSELKIEGNLKLKSELSKINFSETLREIRWNFVGESNQKMFYLCFVFYVCL